MNDIKQTVQRSLTACRRIVTRRWFAGAVLAVVTVVMAVLVSVNSRAVNITDGGECRVVLTMQSDPYKVLENAGVDISADDEITAGENSIDIRRAMTVQVNADGLSTLIAMTDGTVADALTRSDITLGQHDKVSAALTDPVAESMVIQVDRIAYREYTAEESIPFETKTQYTNTIKSGKSRVATAGVKGVRAVTYRETVVNGKVTETVVVSSTVTKQPVTQVVLKGMATGVPLSPAPSDIEFDSNGIPLHYKTVYTGKSCTAYSSHGPGASHLGLGLGKVAVNPKLIPYGTKLWITSANGKYVYGYAIAADTGAFVRGTKTFMDLCFDTYKEACAHGRRNMNIYVLE